MERNVQEFDGTYEKFWNGSKIEEINKGYIFLFTFN
jgi:hypothetical protein